MGNNGRRWVAAGLVGWLAIAFISIAVSSERLGPHLFFIVLQQLLFFVCGVLGTDWGQVARPTLTTAVQGVLLGIGLYITNTVTMISVVKLLDFFGAQWALRLVYQERLVMETILRSGLPGALPVVFLLVVVGAPLAEELFFRGALLTELTKILGRRNGLLLSSLLFAALHLYFIQFIPVLVAGLYLGLIVLRTKNLLTAVVAHALANGLTFLVMLTVL